MRWPSLIMIIAVLALLIGLLTGCNRTDPQEDWDPTKPIEMKIDKEHRILILKWR